MNPADAFVTVAGFSGDDLTETLARIEQALVGVTTDNCSVVLHHHHADRSVLSAAGSVKRLAGQINGSSFTLSASCSAYRTCWSLAK